MNHCCPIKLSGPQECEWATSTPPFVAVRRPHAALSRPLVYLSQHPDARLVDCLVSRGWDVWRAKSVADALNLVKANRLHAGIVDFGDVASPDVVSFEALLRDPRVGWLAFADDERLRDISIARLIRHCCFDYVRNATAYTTIGYLVGHAYGMLRLADGSPDADAAPPGGTMIGSCDAMRRLFATIRKVANTEATVFIAGESGTGKELTAAAIHQQSSRADAPFVAQLCQSRSYE